MAKRVTTVGQVLINRALPKELRDYQRILDAKGIKQLLREVAERFPDRYREIAHDLMQVARRVAYETGGNSFGIRHLRRTPYSIALRRSLDRQVERILDDDSLTDEQREKKLLELAQKYQKEQQQKVYEEALAEQNPLAMQVFSGARGKPANLSSLLGSDLLYVDHRDRPIPLPVRKNYSEGLSPLEYWSGAYGARKGVIDVKLCIYAGEKVLMADWSVKEIRHIRPGDMVMGADFQGRLSPTRVVRVYDNGLRPCYRWKFRTGQSSAFVELTATEDHKVLAQIKAQKQARSRYGPQLIPLREAKERKNPAKQEYVAYGWRAAGPSDLSGDSANRECALTFQSEEFLGDLPTFDLEVECDSHMFCLASGLIVSNSTASAGFFGKQLAQLAHRLVVVGEDDEEVMPPTKGLPVDTDDEDNEGALLAAPVGGYPRNTILTPKILRDLSRRGYKRILVRSPVLGGPAEGGVLARDVGVRETGRLPSVGELTGMTAAQAISEPISQGSLCLVKGTKVRMADGSVKPIEEIRPGDYVLGADTSARAFPVRVLRAFDNGPKPCYRTWFRYCKGQDPKALHLDSTLDHKILAITMKWTCSGERWNSVPRILPVGTKCAEFSAVLPESVELTLRGRRDDARLLGCVPSKNVQYARCSRTGQEYLGELPTYDIEVDHPDHLFVLENGLIVSNSSKHSGGVAGEAKTVSGFQLLDALVQFPSSFQGAAVHAQKDGTVGGIQPAPAGGHYLYIDGEKHYVPESATLKVKPGDVVEAGDVLTSGVPHPAEIIRHKGIGEGRRYFVQAMVGAMRDAGITAHRRNVELVARGLIDHVKMTDEWEDYLPDDIVGYNALERRWKPREGSQKLSPRQAAGQYLERPYLHYTIGTKLRPSVIKTLEEFGINEVETHRDPPPFVPEPVRAMYSLQHDPDPLTRMYGSGLKKSLLDATHRGAVSDEEGTSFVPALARGVEFGHIGKLQHKQAGLLEDSEDSLVAPGLSPLQQLIRLKQLSDQGRYRDKSQIARALIASRPDEFFIDSDDHPYVYGLTHRPTGFRFHLPRHEVPKVLLSQPVQEEETTHGTS